MSRFANGKFLRNFSWNGLLRFSREISVIFVSITLSFLFDEWRDNERDRKQARFYLNRIHKEVQEDLAELQLDLASYHNAEKAFSYFRNHTGVPATGNDSLQFYLPALFTNTYPLIGNSGYATLLTTGRISILQNEELITRLLDAYQEKIPALQADVNSYLERKKNITDPYIFDHIFIHGKTSSADFQELLKDPRFRKIIGFNHRDIIRRYESAIRSFQVLEKELEKELKNVE